MNSEIKYVILKALERYEARIREVSTMGWWKEETTAASEIARIEAARAYVGELGEVQATPGPWEPAYIPDDLDPMAELGRMLEGGNGRVYYVCAPNHPDSSEDGVAVIAITGNGKDSEMNARFIASLRPTL